MAKKQDFSAIGEFITPPTTEEKISIKRTKLSSSETEENKKVTPDSITDTELRAILEARGYKAQLIENKTKRLNLLIQPTLHARVKAYADKKELSVNVVIEEAIKKFLEANE